MPALERRSPDVRSSFTSTRSWSSRMGKPASSPGVVVETAEVTTVYGTVSRRWSATRHPNDSIAASGATRKKSALMRNELVGSGQYLGAGNIAHLSRRWST